MDDADAIRSLRKPGGQGGTQRGQQGHQLNPKLKVPSLIEGLRVVQGLRVVPVSLYRYSMKN